MLGGHEYLKKFALLKFYSQRVDAVWLGVIVFKNSLKNAATSLIVMYFAQVPLAVRVILGKTSFIQKVKKVLEQTDDGRRTLNTQSETKY